MLCRTIHRTRTALALLVAVALVAVTAACSSNNSTAPESGKVELRFAWWGNAARAELTNTAIKAFEAENPNITVKPEYGDIGGYFDKLATQVAANDAPD